MNTTPTQPFTKRLNWELVAVHGVLLVVAIFMLLVARELSEVARRAPTLFLSAMIALILLDLAITVTQAIRGQPRPDLDTDKVDAPMWYQFAHIGGFVACGLLIYYLGYRIATPIFLAAFLLVMRVRLKVLVPLVGGTWLFVYIVFSEILRVR